MKIQKFVLIVVVFGTLFLQKVHSKEWKTFLPLNTPRAGAASVVLDGKIYVLGGKSLDNKVLNTVECYDPANQVWLENAIPPFKKERYNAAAVAFNGKIYLIGGRSAEEILEEVEVYDPVQNKWEGVQNIHEAREGHVAFILNNHIYIIGGQENEYELTKEIEWYDEARDKWEEENKKCPFPRVAQFGASVNDLYYMFGGYYYGMSKESYRWNKQNMHKSWEQLPSLSQPRAYGATVVKDDSIFLIGGETPSGKSDLVEVFDVSNESFQTGPPLPSPRSGLSGVALNDTIYVMGGYDNETGNPTVEVNILAETATAIEPLVKGAFPESKILIHGYPNPFNGQISLEVEFPQFASYQIDIYNLTGQHVKTLFNGAISRGSKHFNWQGRNDLGQAVSSGIYWLVVRSAEHLASFKIVYAK